MSRPAETQKEFLLPSLQASLRSLARRASPDLTPQITATWQTLKQHLQETTSKCRDIVKQRLQQESCTSGRSPAVQTAHAAPPRWQRSCHESS